MKTFYGYNSNPSFYVNTFIYFMKSYCVYLNDDAAFVVTKRDVIGTAQAAHAPHPLHAVVQRALQSVGAGVPDAHRA